ncbi:MAG: Rv2175c family DNA-binding protein [Mycobacteriales bacterium]
MSEMLSYTDVAQRLGVGITGVKQLIKEHKLLAVKTDEGMAVPALALDGDIPVKHLSGVLTLLHDAGYSPEESYRWLTEEDDTLPGTPLQALHENRATEVKRRAQALAF